MTLGSWLQHKLLISGNLYVINTFFYLMKLLIHTFMTFLFMSNLICAQDFKSEFYKAHIFIDYELYEMALPAFLELDRAYPGNSNVQAIIGYLYLHTPNQKEKSLKFLQSSQDKLSAYYKFRNHKEECAPIQSIWFLGKAYHANQQYEKALEKFSEYKEALRKSNKKDIAEINRDIQLSQNAKKSVSNSI